MFKENNLEDLKQDNLDELEVLNKVIASLQNLQHDVRERLLKTVITFFGIKSIKLSSGNEVREESFLSGHDNIQSISTFSEDRSMSPKAFLLEKQPKTDVERVACLAYYLTHYRETPHFKTIDISKLNTEAAQIKFSNPATAVDNATSLGYLALATKAQKQISAVGEIFVQRLPDRTAAKEAMSKTHTRKKSKSSAKAKKDT